MIGFVQPPVYLLPAKGRFLTFRVSLVKEGIVLLFFCGNVIVCLREGTSLRRQKSVAESH